MTDEKQLLLLISRLLKDSERSKVFALQAKKDGHVEIAKLFKALTASQAIQAHRFLIQIRGKTGSTSDNIRSTFEQNIPAWIDEYNSLASEAEKQGAKALETGFRHSATVQQQAIDLHKKLEKSGNNADYYVCDFCGYLAQNEAPENCPVCTAPKKRFKKTDEI